MNAGQLAALIAAGSFAVLVCAGVYVLLRMGRLVSAATTLVTGYRERADALLDQAQEAVDRATEQIARTDAITASMDEVTANVAELSGHVSSLTGLARNLSAAVGAPVTGISAVAYGVRRAVALRRPEAVAQEAAPRRPEAGLSAPDNVAPLAGRPGGRAALPPAPARARTRRSAARNEVAR